MHSTSKFSWIIPQVCGKLRNLIENSRGSGPCYAKHLIAQRYQTACTRACTGLISVSFALAIALLCRAVASAQMCVAQMHVAQMQAAQMRVAQTFTTMGRPGRSATRSPHSGPCWSVALLQQRSAQQRVRWARWDCGKRRGPCGRRGWRIQWGRRSRGGIVRVGGGSAIGECGSGSSGSGGGGGGRRRRCGRGCNGDGGGWRSSSSEGRGAPWRSSVVARVVRAVRQSAHAACHVVVSPLFCLSPPYWPRNAGHGSNSSGRLLQRQRVVVADGCSTSHLSDSSHTPCMLDLSLAAAVHPIVPFAKARPITVATMQLPDTPHVSSARYERRSALPTGLGRLGTRSAGWSQGPTCTPLWLPAS